MSSYRRQKAGVRSQEGPEGFASFCFSFGPGTFL